MNTHIKFLEHQYNQAYKELDFETAEEFYRIKEILIDLNERAGQVEPEVIVKLASIKEQALKGLLTDGGHHKQWFLEAILGMLTTGKEWLYLKEKEQWEEGIVP